MIARVGRIVFAISRLVILSSLLTLYKCNYTEIEKSSKELRSGKNRHIIF